MSHPSEPLRVGRYELLHRLGKGGIGEVWAATLVGPRGFRREVAVKRLIAGLAVDGEALVREARLGATLAHPNIVAVHDLVDVDGQWMVVMERVRGPNAHQLLRDGPLPPRAALEIALQTCAALREIHAAGLIHRDIKPANLLIDRSGVVKVADLGLVLAVGTAEHPAGTPGYVAPEQIAGHPGPASDLFSLGATLATLVSGKRPFGSGDDALAAVRRSGQAFARSGVPERLEAALPGLAAVVSRCLRTDPSERFASATELSDALRPLLAGAGGRGLGGLLGDEASDERVPSVSELPTVAVRRGNLPAELDRYVGRDALVSELRDQLAGGGALVTLLGTGGAGKTRLACRVARALDALDGGAWFCDLEEAVTAEGVLGGVSRMLGLPAGDAKQERIGQALRELGDCVVVLDNLEQVAGPAAPLIEAWHGVAPRARLLVTSRTVLRVRGEQVRAIGALPDAEAAELFHERAQRDTRAEHPAVLELVRALDGLPLAIELAAARTRTMDVRALRERLGQRFRLLARPDPTLPERQRSLRASIDVSWELLAPWERLALGQLSCFAGGFALEAAEAVLRLPPEAPWSVDVLDALVGHSLVSVEAGRFRLPVAISEYASETLGPAERAAAEASHGAYFGTLARHLAQRMWSGVDLGLIEPALADFENLVVAAQRPVVPAEDAAACAVLAGRLALVHGPAELGRRVLEGALTRVDGPPRARLLSVLASVLESLGRFDQMRERADELAALDLDRTTRIRAWVQRGTALAGVGRVAESQAVLDQALALADVADVARAEVALALGEQARNRGDYAAARRWYDEVLATATRHDAPRVRLLALQSLATVDLYQGRFVDARARYDEALRLAGQSADSIPRTWTVLGYLHQAQGQLREAAPWLRSAAARHRQRGRRLSEHHAQVNLAFVLSDLGELDEAQALADGARRFFAEADVRSHLGWATGVAAQVRFHRGELDVAVKLARMAAEECESQGQVREAAASRMVAASALEFGGRLDEALAEAEHAVRLAPDGNRLSARTRVAWVLWRLGRVAEARAASEEDAGPASVGTAVERSCVEVALLRASGDAVAAERVAAEVAVRMDAMGYHPGHPSREQLRLASGG